MDFPSRKPTTGAGPVMNELVNHPEWMPLLLDDRGEAPIERSPWRHGFLARQKYGYIWLCMVNLWIYMAIELINDG